MRLMSRSLLVTLCLVVASTGGARAAAPAPPDDLLTNGGFETGDFSGWTVRNRRCGAPSLWAVYGVRRSPLSNHAVPLPPEGKFAALTDQADSGKGSHLLYQDVHLEAGGVYTLSFTLFFGNYHERFVVSDSLDCDRGVNQQFRVDILDPAAPEDSILDGDVLATVFRTRVGDAAQIDPRRVSFDLTPFAGRDVRVRFAEVDTAFYFLVGVDDVRVTRERGRALRWDPPDAVGAPPRFVAAAEEGERGTPGAPGALAGYRVYGAPAADVRPSPDLLVASVGPDATGLDLPPTSTGFFALTAVYADGTESVPSNMVSVRAGEAVVRSAQVAGASLTLTGEGFVGKVEVRVDGLGFPAAAGAKKGGTRVKQKGILSSGETIEEHVRARGGVVLLEVRNGSGGVTAFKYVAPA